MASSCAVSRMMGLVARKSSMAGCQGWEHTEPCLKLGHVPNTGAERGWVKGYETGCWTRQEGIADTSRRANWVDYYKLNLC